VSDTEFEGGDGTMGVVASIEFFWSNMADPAIPIFSQSNFTHFLPTLPVTRRISVYPW
jgi:hypothetical protein